MKKRDKIIKHLLDLNGYFVTIMDRQFKKFVVNNFPANYRDDLINYIWEIHLNAIPKFKGSVSEGRVKAFFAYNLKQKTIRAIETNKALKRTAEWVELNFDVLDDREINEDFSQELKSVLDWIESQGPTAFSLKGGKVFKSEREYRLTSTQKKKYDKDQRQYSIYKDYLKMSMEEKQKAGTNTYDILAKKYKVKKGDVRMCVWYWNKYVRDNYLRIS